MSEPKKPLNEKRENEPILGKEEVARIGDSFSNGDGQLGWEALGENALNRVGRTES